MENKNMHHLNKIAAKRELNSQVSKEQKEELLLLGTSSEAQDQYNVLKKIGLTNHIDLKKKQQSVEQEVYVEQESFNRPAFKGAELIALCEKFNLFLVRGDDFKGIIPLEFATAISDFEKSNEFSTDMSETRTVTKSKVTMTFANFYILCTENMPTSKTLSLFYTQAGTDIMVSTDSKDVIKDSYKQRVENSIFLEVCSTGKPFSKTRAFYGMTNDIVFVLWYVVALIALAITSLLFHIPALILVITAFSIIVTMSTTWKDQKWYKYLIR